MKPVISPKELAIAIGVSESSMKRWADDGKLTVSRTAGGHRRIPIHEAIRFIREIRAPLIRPDALGLDGVSIPSGEIAPAPSAEALTKLLLDGDDGGARGLLMSLYLKGRSVADIIDDTLQKSLESIGTQWKHSSAGIYKEHRAVDICIQALTELRLAIGQRKDGPIALGGAPSNDSYILPSMSAAMVVASEGFTPINLGPNTPFETFREAVDSNNPVLVWITVSHIENKSKLSDELREFVRWSREKSINVVIGGHHIDDLDDTALAGARKGKSMRELSAFAQGLMTSRTPK